MPCHFPIVPLTLARPAECARQRALLCWADRPRYWRELAAQARLLGEFDAATRADALACWWAEQCP
jgi:hypothetical protein